MFVSSGDGRCWLIFFVNANFAPSQDVLDGYFPSEFREEYPEGVSKGEPRIG